MAIRGIGTWRGESVKERTADARDVLYRRTVSASDTVITLEDQEFTHSARVTVAQISDCGWVDFFGARIEDDAAGDESKHFSLCPSDMETLVKAYAAWKIAQTRRDFYSNARYALHRATMRPIEHYA